MNKGNKNCTLRSSPLKIDNSYETLKYIKQIFIMLNSKHLIIDYQLYYLVTHLKRLCEYTRYTQHQKTC